MTIETAVTAGFVAVATAIRSLRTLITGSPTGTLSGLNTISKTSVVSALSEVRNAGNLGFRYTFSQTGQTGRAWVQAVTLTSVYDVAGGAYSRSGGNFTFAANTVANVARHWMFTFQAGTVTALIPVSVEIRVDGVSIARQSLGYTTATGLTTMAQVCCPFLITGGNVVSFHFYHGSLTTQPITGVVSGVCL